MRRPLKYFFASYIGRGAREAREREFRLPLAKSIGAEELKMLSSAAVVEERRLLMRRGRRGDDATCASQG